MTFETVEKAEGEDWWQALGEEKSDCLVNFEEEQAKKAARRRRGR